MQTRSDGNGDRIAALDAFKIARQGERCWKVAPLTPWARQMMELEGSLSTLRTDGTAVVCETRTDAMAYVRECEQSGESWAKRWRAGR